MLIGGASIIFMFLSFLVPRESSTYSELIALTWGIQFVINYPHFAASYQLFYKDIFSKVKNTSVSLYYRLLTINAAFICPLVIISLMFYFIYLNDVSYLGYFVNAMFFFVGWHYVKQGYGMLIVMSVRRKFYFSLWEKKLLLCHTYCAWLLSYISANNTIDEKFLHGIPWKSFDVSNNYILQIITSCIFITWLITFVLIIQYIIRKIYRKETLPSINGIIGYFSSVYLWTLILVNPLFFAFIPMFHSLQYLMFVYKYKESEFRNKGNIHNFSFIKRMCIFFFTSVVLGASGFYFLPHIMDYFIPVDSHIFGSSLFLFVFMIFINIHHYFIDNVIWKKDNKKAMQYLLSN